MTLMPLAQGAGQADTPVTLSLTRNPRLSRNVFYRAGRFIRRMAIQPLHTGALSVPIRGLFTLKSAPPATVTVTIFVGSAGDATRKPAIFRIVGSAPSQVLYNGVIVVNTFAPQYPWIPAELNNTSALLCKRGLRSNEPDAVGKGVLLHATANAITRAGIPAPTTAPTMSDVGGGTLANGTWAACRYSFVTDDGRESNASPSASVTTTSGGTGKRRWAALEVSPHPRVTTKRLYLPKVGASNTNSFDLVDIPNATTQYDETLPDSALGFKSYPTTNLLPPLDPEHVVIWNEAAFVTSNDAGFGGPGWSYTYVDEGLIPQFEAFDADRRVIRIPPRGGQRAVCAVPWDGQGLKRLALFSDASVHVISPTVQSEIYSGPDELDLRHGAAGPLAAAAGGSWLVWCDGVRVLASDGGPSIVISTDSVQAALKNMPRSMAEQIAITYRRAEQRFSLAFASTAASTYNDLELWWSPDSGWSEASYAQTSSAPGRAPVVYGTAPSGTPTHLGDAPSAIDIAAFSGDNRVFWLDSPALRDQWGSAIYPVWLDIEWPPLSDGEGNKLVTSKAVVAFGHRRDSLYASDVDPVLSLALNLDDTRATPSVSAVVDEGALSAPCHNFGDPARSIGLRCSGPCEPPIEIVGAWLDAASVGARVPV